MKIKLTESEIIYFSDILKTTYIQENINVLDIKQMKKLLNTNNIKLIESFFKEATDNPEKIKKLSSKIIIRSGDKMMDILARIVDTVETEDYKLYNKITNEYKKLSSDWEKLKREREIDLTAASSIFGKIIIIIKTVCRMGSPIAWLMFILTMSGLAIYHCFMVWGTILGVSYGVVMAVPIIIMIGVIFSIAIDIIKHISVMLMKKPEDVKKNEKQYMKQLKQKADKIYSTTLNLLNKVEMKNKEKYKSKLKKIKIKMDKNLK